jgi:hypothetical protein
MAPPLQIIVAVLATWRVTHLLASEDGPADVIAKFRALLGQSLAGELMDCFNCMSLWIAAPAALFVTRHLMDWLLVWLAVSGAACLLQRLGREPVVMQPVFKTSEGDTYHVLRSETSGVTEQFDAHNHADSAANNSWPSTSSDCSVPGSGTNFGGHGTDVRAEPS